MTECTAVHYAATRLESAETGSNGRGRSRPLLHAPQIAEIRDRNSAGPEGFGAELPISPAKAKAGGLSAPGRRASDSVAF
jgi:hypothetical protein